MIDKRHIGKVFPRHTVEVEKSAVRLFVKVIGETDPVYTDESVARAAGHRSPPVPPTFLFGLEMSRPNALAWLHEIGANPARILHSLCTPQSNYVSGQVVVCGGGISI